MSETRKGIDQHRSMTAAQRQFFQRYIFFRDHAGSIVGECAKGALALARAERWAHDNDIRFDWDHDDWDYKEKLGDHAYWCRDEARGITHQHTVFFCQCIRDDETTHGGYEVLASLSGIIDPDRNYRRVVEAQLAQEALDDERKRSMQYLYEGIA